MRSAERGGEDDDEDEDEEEVVVLENAGCAVTRGGGALQVAAASAAATAGRMDAISSGCGLGIGGCKGLVAIRLSGGRMWPAAACRGGMGLRSAPRGLHRAGLLQFARMCASVPTGGTVRAGCLRVPGGMALW